MMELGMKSADVIVQTAYLCTIIIFFIMFHVTLSKSAIGMSTISEGFEEIIEHKFKVLHELFHLH